MLTDVIRVYKKAAKKAGQAIGIAPGILCIPLLFGVLEYLTYTLVGPIIQRMGMLGGFVLAFIEAALLTLAFQFYEEVIRYDRLPRNFRINSGNLWGVYSVLFLFMLLRLIGSALGSMAAFVPILFTVLLLPIPEEIYLKGRTYTDAFEGSLSFMKENWFHFLLPYILYILLASVIQGVPPMGRLLGTDVMKIPFGMEFYGFREPVFIVRYILAQFIAGTYMVFRGKLFLELDGSSRRKREYMEGWE